MAKNMIPERASRLKNISPLTNHSRGLKIKSRRELKRIRELETKAISWRSSHIFLGIIRITIPVRRAKIIGCKSNGPSGSIL
jgi:hypothetical protein